MKWHFNCSNLVFTMTATTIIKPTCILFSLFLQVFFFWQPNYQINTIQHFSSLHSCTSSQAPWTLAAAIGLGLLLGPAATIFSHVFLNSFYLFFFFVTQHHSIFLLPPLTFLPPGIIKTSCCHWAVVWCRVQRLASLPCPPARSCPWPLPCLMLLAARSVSRRTG